MSDADFYNHNTNEPIRITALLGDLDAALMSLDRYSDFLRGFDAAYQRLEDEPGHGLETALELQLCIDAELIPEWRLLSDRVDPEAPARPLQWSGRQRLEPVRIGIYSETHLGWRRGSILERLTDESAQAPAALATATRATRESFGDSVDAQLSETLAIANRAARTTGLDQHGDIDAALDAHAVALSSGALSLHDGRGVPLRNLGLSSSRLLIAALQRQAGQNAAIALIDEVEHGLEPHRIKRLLDILGAKDKSPTTQQFITTHSPSTIRELSDEQLFPVRSTGSSLHLVSTKNRGAQGTLRVFPEAFLGHRILLCEEATEIGLMRGLDRHFVERDDEPAFSSEGAVLVDAGGASGLYRPALVFQKLGYDVAVLRNDDADEQIDKTKEAAFEEAGGCVFHWPNHHSLEIELFSRMSEQAVVQLFQYVEEERGATLARDNLKFFAREALHDVSDWLADVDDEKRGLLAQAALKCGWLKSISLMEAAAYEIIGPDLSNATESLSEVVDHVFVWVNPKHWETDDED